MADPPRFKGIEARGGPFAYTVSSLFLADCPFGGLKHCESVPHCGEHNAKYARLLRDGSRSINPMLDNDASGECAEHTEDLFDKL